MLTNRFQGSCDTFGEGKRKPIIVNNIRSPGKNKFNDHGVDVSMIITI